ncbi:hypothetical protein [Thiomicrorhabdus xiamenensis]|uniref:Uncharacterized protein n=1 Tax=Thiomicrorhabdus xiamenensis TaxID=2739063 RepID=A0A7D4TA35_9GAMM|nr:hypothetical protein [Thiomicrorhabdus xiamenensis]QKI88966.1 hypothetical protein HQN79_04960 [Thiomicrorhabdus xiamenensis]
MANHSVADKQRINDLFTRVRDALQHEQIPTVDDLVALEALAWNYQDSATDQLKGLRNYAKASATDYTIDEFIEATHWMMKGKLPKLTNRLIKSLNAYLTGKHNASGVFGRRTTKVYGGQSWQLDGFITQFIEQCRCSYRSYGTYYILRSNGRILSKDEDSPDSVYNFCAELSAACLDNEIETELPNILEVSGLLLHENYFKQLAQELCNEITYLRSIGDDAQTLRSTNRWHPRSGD